MVSAGTSFINSWAAKDSKIGIVDFDSYGRHLADLTPIDTAVSREYLVDKFNSMRAANGTDIDAGISVGIQVRELK